MYNYHHLLMFLHFAKNSRRKLVHIFHKTLPFHFLSSYILSHISLLVMCGLDRKVQDKATMSVVVSCMIKWRATLSLHSAHLLCHWWLTVTFNSLQSDGWWATSTTRFMWWLDRKIYLIALRSRNFHFSGSGRFSLIARHTNFQSFLPRWTNFCLSILLKSGV